MEKKLAIYRGTIQILTVFRGLHIQESSDMIKFLTQPEIEAVLLSAILGLMGWFCIRGLKWLTSRKRAGGNQYLPKHQLPALSSNFTGRDQELEQFEQRVTNSRKSSGKLASQHLVLYGMGGVGKTTLATALANRLKNHFKSAQLYINLRGSHPDGISPLDPAEVMRTIIQALSHETRLPEAIDQLLPIYNSVLSDAGNTLLFFDDAADAEQIRHLLPSPNCFLIITSRAAFSLAGASSFKVDCLNARQSEELLLKLAPRLIGNEKDAASLCANLPLALEVFAGIVNDKQLYAVPILLRLLRDNHQLSPVDAVLKQSSELLPDDLQKRWISLSIFPDYFDLAAVGAVWEESENVTRESLQLLVNASLVEWNEQNGHFNLHDLVRLFCQSTLSESGRAVLNARYAKHYRDIMVAAVKCYRKGGDDSVRGLKLFDSERTHVQKMFEILCSKQDVDSASSLVSMLDAMGTIFELRFQPRQRIRWLECQLTASRLLNDKNAECKAVGYLGASHSDLGNVDKAIELLEQALALSREIGYRRGEYVTLGHLGIIQRHLGETEKASINFRKALDLMVGSGDDESKGRMLNFVGCIYKDAGDYEKSIETLEEALSCARNCEDKRSEASIIANLGTAYVNLDKIHKGIELLQSALVINSENGDRLQKSRILCGLGQALARLDRFEEAIQCHDNAVQLVRQSGNVRQEGLALSSYASMMAESGQLPKAIALGEQSLAILETVKDPFANIARENLATWRQLSDNLLPRTASERDGKYSPSLEW